MCHFVGAQLSVARDLDQIKEAGVLRHIGIPYSNFIIYSETNGVQTLSGLDVELMQGFAQHLEVDYQFVPATTTNYFGKLIGQEVFRKGSSVVFGELVPIEGDILACGMTILDWRKKVVDFADDSFPSAIWLVARGDSDLQPIIPTGSTVEDIKNVKKRIKGRDVLTLDQSCIDSSLYNLAETGANILFFDRHRNLNEMAPAIINNDAELGLLDVADALKSLQKWPGKIKVIGPISDHQFMAPMFRKTSPLLRQEFNKYLQSIKENGDYLQLIKKYYPSIFFFYSEYFETM